MKPQDWRLTFRQNGKDISFLVTVLFDYAFFCDNHFDVLYTLSNQATSHTDTSHNAPALHNALLSFTIYYHLLYHFNVNDETHWKMCDILLVCTSLI